MRVYRTKQRMLLLDYLKENTDTPLCAEEIARGLSECECGCTERVSVSSVYRNLALLAAGGDVRRFTADDGRTALYQYVDHVRCDTHLHLRCTVCGRLLHMDEELSTRVMRAVFGSANFMIDGKQTVLHGVCGECSANEQSKGE
ncbi:MAG: transcriptional repressor [Oscillospiraceae bacterium]|nr:transcriptional repressor [Oscillospiraceae bacterium]